MNKYFYNSVFILPFDFENTHSQFVSPYISVQPVDVKFDLSPFPESLNGFCIRFITIDMIEYWRTFCCFGKLRGPDYVNIRKNGFENYIMGKMLAILF